jgi:aspartyl-tRNA(Asn)/glutamyl-tRNA(Gln) amidotransferase subunit A
MDIEHLTIDILLEGYRNKSFSVTEVVKAYLDRIDDHDVALHTFNTVTHDIALKQAAELDKKNQKRENSHPLFGVPIAYKDLFSTKGVRTTASSNVLDDYIPEFNATTVDRYEDAGTVMLGKLNCDAWAHGSSGENSDFGPAKNPYNPEYTPGGSSSGSAASVAASLTPLATGTDTGGSIRLPASFTNTVGLKPTYGLVSRYGVIAMASSLDSIGHFTKTVKDSALVLNVTSGPDGMDSTLRETKEDDYTKLIGQDIKGMKIGVPKEYVGAGLEPAVKAQFEKALKVFEKLGAEIVDVSLPMTEYGIATYYIIQPSEVSSNLARFDGIRFGNDRSFFGDEAKRRIMLGTFTLSSGYYDAFYNKAMKVRTLIVEDYKKAFSKVDALVAPVSPTLPWKLGEKVNDPLAMYLSDALTVTINIAGIPSLSVPAGFSENGLPIGIQIMGNYFDEKKLFQIGSAFEKETEYYLQVPKL